MPPKRKFVDIGFVKSGEFILVDWMSDVTKVSIRYEKENN